ncbi:unnamed protein product [Somion occarium]|uniref:Association with the SNF1 complex (ASC) domain-containing protein n=1 Tax=Somion occarium TaxID=3059160 RepID=A0ABP1E179_9APHY
MGNSASSAINQNNLHANSSRLDSSSNRTGSPARGGSPAPNYRGIHKSLRQKKKSLELPDLASLTLTPASSPQSVSPHNAYRRPRASSPIPIPVSANPQPQTFRPQNNLPSAAHLPFNNQHGGNRSRHKSYLSSAYPSTHSFVSGSPPEPVPEEPPAHSIEYVPEVVHSTLPVLLKADDDASKPEPITVLIKWRGGGKTVFLARAGDDNWNGRTPMDFDPHTNTWTAAVQLLPGTHHFKFIVDDQWRIAEDYSTAVDDRDGSLANYVNVTSSAISSSCPRTPARLSPLASPNHSHPSQFNSFWSDNSTANGVATSGSSTAHDGEWTTVIPPELIQAAAEEENYLASADSPTSSSSIPAPNIPPAPTLPRHLDKLILNVRTSAVTGSGSGSASGSSATGSEREKSRKGSRSHHSRRDREGRSRPSNLGMTSAVSEGTGISNAEQGEGQSGIPPSLTLPVVTASGTDVTTLSGTTTPIQDQASDGPGSAKKVAVAKLDGPAIADDASVLPVPNHVVLHHLSTSAIRNGVLAVANTTRYRKKVCYEYITTIYYKPT